MKSVGDKVVVSIAGTYRKGVVYAIKQIIPEQRIFYSIKITLADADKIPVLTHLLWTIREDELIN